MPQSPSHLPTRPRLRCPDGRRAGVPGALIRPTGPMPAAPALATAAAALSFQQLSAGEDYTCGVTTDEVPRHGGRVLRRGGDFFNQVSTGFRHTCGRTPAAVAYCWGSGFAGQLGNGTTASSPTPVAVAGPT